MTGIERLTPTQRRIYARILNNLSLLSPDSAEADDYFKEAIRIDSHNSLGTTASRFTTTKTDNTGRRSRLLRCSWIIIGASGAPLSGFVLSGFKGIPSAPIKFTFFLFSFFFKVTMGSPWRLRTTRTGFWSSMITR